MFKPNGLLWENGLIFKVSHFPRVSRLDPNRLTLEKWLSLESKSSVKIKPIYTGINNFLRESLKVCHFLKSKPLWPEMAYSSENGLFSKVSRFLKSKPFSLKTAYSWKMAYLSKESR